MCQHSRNFTFITITFIEISMRIKSKLKSNVMMTSVLTTAVLLSGCGGGSDGVSITDNIDQNQAIQCVNGIPKNLKTKGDGVLSQELFGLETNIQNNQSTLFFTSNVLEQGVLYEKISQLIPNNVPSSFSEFDSGYQISPNHLTTQFKLKVGSNGFPVGYVLSQNNEAMQFVPFSDQCNTQPERQIAMHLKTIDLSGQNISKLLAYYQLNSTETERLINSDLYNKISSNTALYQKFLASTATFPANSKIYYIDKTIYTQPIFYFNDNSNKPEFNSLDAYISHADQKLPSGYSWKKDQFAGHPIAYPINSKTGSYAFLQSDKIFPAVQYNGKIYQAKGAIPGDIMQYAKNDPNEAVEMETTYFNKAAAQFFADAIK